MKVRSYGQSDRGLVREKNEDAFLVDRLRNIYAVADGLGGLPRGDDASNMAVRILAEILENHPGDTSELDLTSAFKEINEEVFRKGRSHGEDIGMGTTLTGARIVDRMMNIAHVGDSVMFRFRPGDWQQLTIDHTMEREIRSRLQPGEETFIPEYFSHTLTRCIGQAEDIEVDTYHLEVEAGDRFILCSDGITKTIKPDEISRLIFRFPSPESCVEGLILLANNRGGPDNATAIALFLED